MFTLGTLQTLKTLRTYLFRYAEEYPAINGGDEFGMNYIFTNRNKNYGLQAAVFISILHEMSFLIFLPDAPLKAS